MRKLSDYGPSLIVLFTAAVVLLAGPFAVREITFARDQARIHQAAHRLAESDVLAELNQAYRDIATFVEPSVVHISAAQFVRTAPFGEIEPRLSTGSGWIFDDLGHVVTNYHVVEDAQRIEVQLYDGELREAELLGSDPTTDIAVLKIPPGRLHPAELADPSESVLQGDLVFAFGSPFNFRFSMSSGVISGKGRSVGVIRSETGQAYENFIQVDAAINPGNSGGPLTDFRGRVIGMNTAIPTEDGEFSGVGLAIPVSMIYPTVSQIVETGVVSKGFLGISALDRQQPVAWEMRTMQFTGFGVVIGHIASDSPFTDNGLHIGDIITHVNNQQVATIAQFQTAISAVDADDEVYVRLWRYDANRDVGREVVVEIPGILTADMSELSLVQANESVGREMELMGFTGRGVRVIRCQPDGPARAAGVKRFDIITHVNDEPIETMLQLQSIISSIRPGDIAKLTIWRYQPETDSGTIIHVDVPLARMDRLRITGLIPPDQDKTQIAGLGIAKMSSSTKKLARKYDMAYHPGVIIEECVEGSPLKEQIPTGSTLVAVMDRTVSNVDEFLNEMRRYNLFNGVRVTIVDPHGRTSQPILGVIAE